MADIFVETGADTTVNGNNFQAAINSSVRGDNIILTAGATYFRSGGFQFGDKGAGTSYVTVRSDSMASGPAEGVRVDPATHAAAMPKLVGSGPPTISVNVNASYWKFECLEVTNDTTNISTALIYTANNGSAGGGYPTYAELFNTHDIIFDRLFVHNPEVTAADLHPEVTHIYAGRGIGLSGVNMTVKNCWIGSFAGYFPSTSVLWDSYGIFGGIGNNILVENNRVEAFFNNIFWAASIVNPDHQATISSPTSNSATLSSVTGLSVGSVLALEVPDDTDECVTDINNPKCYQAVEIDSISGNNITFSPYGAGGITVVPVDGGVAQWDGAQPTNVITTRNYLWKNPWWQEEWPGGAKDYIEVKTCINCEYTANIFEGACSAVIAFEVAQTGSNGGHPWNTITDNLFENNLMLGDASSIFIPLSGAQASGNFTVSNVPGHDIIIRNNLWQNITQACGSSPAISGFLQTAGGQNVEFTHNTVRNVNTVNMVINAAGDGTGQTNLTVKDNIFNYGASGYNSNAVGGYASAWPPAGIVEDGNIVVTDGDLTNDPAGAGQSPNSFRVNTDADIGFTDYITADAGGVADIGGYILAVGSDYKGQATDATDPGVDIEALRVALGLTANPGRKAKKGRGIRGRH